MKIKSNCKSEHHRATAASPEDIKWRHDASPPAIGRLEVARAWANRDVREVIIGHSRLRGPTAVDTECGRPWGDRFSGLLSDRKSHIILFDKQVGDLPKKRQTAVKWAKGNETKGKQAIHTAISVRR